MQQVPDVYGLNGSGLNPSSPLGNSALHIEQKRFFGFAIIYLPLVK